MSNFTLSRISRSDSWATPEELYKVLDSEFHFNDDPCPILHSNDDLFLGGLAREWGTSTFINPPYSKPEPFCRKAYEESLNGKTVVGLLRGDTSTKWFHKWVLPYADLRFVEGRIKFNGKPAPFASIIAIWGCPLSMKGEG
jgi:site-specific DNA-methyltransferase (adenine-specific)